jgi:ParB family chromosome partitioning protein
VADDGLAQEWNGNVWLNPPYAAELVSKFTAKLCQHIEAGDVPQAVLLTNNCTETSWFQKAAERATAICLPAGRVQFLDEQGNPRGAPLQGQTILFFGSTAQRFVEGFGKFGLTRALHAVGA